MKRHLRICLAALALGSLALTGCGSGSAQVSGHVTLGGKPLESGTVTFHAQDGSLQAVGQVGAGGNYTVVAEEGLPPGEYVVTVAAAVVAEEQFGRAEAAPKLLVPGKYTTPETSDLRFTLKPGAQTIDLALKDGS